MIKQLFGFGSADAPVERQEPHIAIEASDSPTDSSTPVLSSDVIRMGEIFGSHQTDSGAVVTDTTAMRVSAVYACVARIAGAVAPLPLPVFERLDGNVPVRVEHPYWWLLNEEPSPVWNSTSYWEFLIIQVLLRGDGIAYIVRNRAGEATALLPWPRSKVIIQKEKGASSRVPGRLRYFFQGDEGYFGADQDDVIHIPGLGFDGVSSMSVIQWGARNGIGIAIKGDEFAGKFYSQGAQPQFAVTSPKSMNPSQQEDFRNAWVKKYTGNGPNGIPLILTEGLDVKELTMSAIDAQLLESRQWQVIDIARAFGVPPSMIGEADKSTSNGNSFEQSGRWFVTYTLGALLSRIKKELNRKLFRTPRYFTEHNVEALMAGDSKAEAEYFAKALGGPGTQGWMSVQEVRRKKNLPPDDNPEFNSVIKAGSKPAATEKKDED